MKQQHSAENRHYQRNRQLLFWTIRIFILITLYIELQIDRTPILLLNIFVFGLTFFPSLIKLAFKIHFPLPLETIYLISLLLIITLEKIFMGAIVQLILGMFFGLFGFLLLYILYYNSRIKSSYPLVALFAFCFSVAIGALWEIFIYLLLTFASLRIGDLNFPYTPIALIWITIGAGIISFGGLLYLKYGESPAFQRLLTTFISHNPQHFHQEHTPDHLQKLINKGENETLEFKSTLRTNLHTKKPDKKIEYAILKTITAFLNSSGGTLLIGVQDNGTIIGIEQDGFKNNDHFYRHFTNIVKDHIGNEFLPFIKTNIVHISNKTVFLIEIDQSTQPVFLTYDQTEEFYIRTGPASVKIEGNKLLQYVKQQFN